jgi:enoyl-CoA hydratase
MYKTLLYKKEDQIGILTINRPDKLNAISNELTRELKDLLNKIEDDEDLRILVITGAGEKAFVAGADIQELVERDAKMGRRVSRERQEVFSRIEDLPVPVIGAVNGYALGGGLEIALACSIRICSDNAQFGAPEVKLGIIPGDGGTQRLPRLIGLGRAMEMILTGDFIDAQEAYRIGIANKVVADGEYLNESKGWAEKLRSKSPSAITMIKRLVTVGIDIDIESALAFESESFGTLSTHRDFKEGVSAFLEKRQANYKGD